jgi:hypothetical protein
MHEQKKLTEAEREAIAAKYQRRIIELGTPIFGPPEEDGAILVSSPDPKAQELQLRIIDATIQLLEAAPPQDEETPHHRKPGDLHRTADRLREGEVDLPDGFDREEAAAAFDRHAQFEEEKIAFGHEMDAVALEALAGLLPILERVNTFVFDVFHEMKRWAEEDPDGPGVGYYQEMARAWRKGAGRSRGKGSNLSQTQTSSRR